MNAFTIDISQHLEDKPKFLKLGPGDENVFRVDDSKNTVLKIQELANNSTDSEAIDKALILGIGQEAVDKINTFNLSFGAYQSIFIGMMATISSLTYEEMEKRFRSTQ